MEGVMKTLLGTAVVLAGLTFGVSNAFANPFIGCGCGIVLRGISPPFTVATFNFPGIEEEDITVAESGNIDAKCKVDLGTGPQQTFDNSNTGFTCSLAGSTGIAPTTDWQEVISANGQTTLQCHFHPGT
jgi:hypothetical protein